MKLRKCHGCASPMVPIKRTTFNWIVSCVHYQCTRCPKTAAVIEPLSAMVMVAIGLALLFAPVRLSYAGISGWSSALGVAAILVPIWRLRRNPVVSDGAANA